jgi:hypothetical protein
MLPVALPGECPPGSAVQGTRENYLGQSGWLQW